MRSATACGNRNDVASAFMPLVERAVAGRDELLEGCRSDGNFTMRPAGLDKDESATQLNIGRLLGKITLFHPDSLFAPNTSGRGGNKAALEVKDNTTSLLIRPFLRTALFGGRTVVTCPTLERIA